MEQTILSVSELNQQAKQLLEGSFGLVWISGEISNFSCPASGHWYFSLKDDKAQVRSAMFRGQNMRVRFAPEDGMQVLVQARVSLYTGRGEFQLIAEHIEPAGVGALQKAFEQLKNKLDKEGLFSEKNKKPLPAFPSSIGIITSHTGAALRDILSVLQRRYPIANIIIYPCMVQGDQAAEQIVNALKTANQRQECDVLILARGGGSLEDLWCFNEEKVARAIFASKIAIVTGIGHETDFTIADFVADYRAPTPSVAAETVSPDQRELMQTIDQYAATLSYQVTRLIKQLNQQVTWLSKRLLQQHPQRLLNDQIILLKRLFDTLKISQERLLENRQAKLNELARVLHAVSPLAVLERGYAVIKKQDVLIKSSQELQAQDCINVQFSDGMVECKVI